MPSLSYKEIYSRFYSKVQAYDFLNLSNVQVDEFLCNWLHSCISKPHVRKLFSKKNGLVLDDEIQRITYEMDYTLDEESDKDFIIEVIAHGIIIEWLSPKINSIQNIAQIFGSSEEKFYSQSNHLSELRNVRDDSIKQQRNIISDRGYSWNTYLDSKK